MISVDILLKVFAEKLIATDSFDAAFKKAVWVAYKEGCKDERKKYEQTNRTMQR
jgi:hypothetical protein